MDKRQLAKDDPITRNVEKDAAGEEMSPMDPPEAYAPPAKEVVPYDELHPFLRGLVDDHRRLIARLDALDPVLKHVKSSGLDAASRAALTEAFAFFEAELGLHHRREERRLFPLLHERLIRAGEHSVTAQKRTGVDVMEDDHLRASRLSAVAAAFVGLASALPEPRSSGIALASGLRQLEALVELLRLHVFREENILFGLAQKHLTAAELDAVLAESR